MRLCKILAMVIVTLSAASATATASWLDALVRAGGKTARHGIATAESVAAHIRTLPIPPGRTVLAASITPEGHWHFVNRAGEMLTASSPDELRRMASILAPEAAAAKLSLHLPEDTVFRHREGLASALKILPADTELHVLTGSESRRLLKSASGEGDRLYAEIRPRVVVAVGEQRLFDEAVWQLSRPLRRSQVRIITFEPGGPAHLAPVPRIDAATKRVGVDAIEPDRLRHALGAIKGQTALITGRRAGELLMFKPSTGPERSLLVRDLTQAAEAADVNLLILSTPTGRQPGARNWLWRKAEVKGLDQALDRATLADFLDALAGDGKRVAVTVRETSQTRARLQMMPAGDLAESGAAGRVGDLFADFVAEITGSAATSTIDASLRSSVREQELEQRIVPGVPSDIQFGYLGAVILGLMGLPVARTWWQRLWPRERAVEYGGRAGYWAARIVRSLLFLLLFMPLVAPLSMPAHVVLQVWGVLTLPMRLWQRLRAHHAGA